MKRSKSGHWFRHDCPSCGKLMVIEEAPADYEHPRTGNHYITTEYICIPCDQRIRQNIPLAFTENAIDQSIKVVKDQTNVVPMFRCGFSNQRMYALEEKSFKDDRTGHNYFVLTLGSTCQHTFSISVPEKVAREEWGVKEMPPKEGIFLTTTLLKGESA